MAEIPSIYTVEEVAQMLKVNAQVVVDEINAGRLEGFKVGDQWRIADNCIVDFISRGGSQNRSNIATREGVLCSRAAALEKIDGFSYKWPDGTIEKYHDAYEGTIKANGGQIQVKVGIGERFAAGKKRRRVVVFLDGRPTVEFVGADDFDTSGLVVSVITLRNRRRLKPGQRVPDEYRAFQVVRYNAVVTGPHAMSAMAVLAKINDLETMISHALIRAKFRDQR